MKKIVLNILCGTTILLITLISCKSSKGLSELINVENSIRLDVFAYPTSFFKQYLITEKQIYVIHSERYVERDSIVAVFDIKPFNYDSYIESFDTLSLDNYQNKCIEDGTVFNLLKIVDSSVVKDVRFSNVYNNHLNGIIELINSNVKKKYKIYYSKEELDKLMDNCN